jgi:hypothetical protein
MASGRPPQVRLLSWTDLTAANNSAMLGIALIEIDADNVNTAQYFLALAGTVEGLGGLVPVSSFRAFNGRSVPGCEVLIGTGEVVKVNGIP